MMIDIADILQDPVIGATDKAKLNMFKNLLSKYLETQEPPGSDWKSMSLFHLCEGAGIDLSSLAKEGQMLSALWVTVLRGIGQYMEDEELRYPTYDDFIAIYGAHYSREDESELQNLWKTANWMHVLFHLLPAKKNKGLVMLVVPRYIEGWHVKYVTGSGQTHLTANRVHLFETEGETKAVHRGKVKAKPKKKTTPRAMMSSSRRAFFGEGEGGEGEGGDGSGSGVGDECHPDAMEVVPHRAQHRELSNSASDSTHRKRRHAHIRREHSAESSADSEFSGDSERKRAKKARVDARAMPPPMPVIPGRCTTELLLAAANEDLRLTYEEFQKSAMVLSGTSVQRDETGLLLPDLLRSESFTLWGPSSVTVPGPPNTQRSVTWGEIPLNLGSANMTQPPSALSVLASTSQAYSLSSVDIPSVKPEEINSTVSVLGSPPPLPLNSVGSSSINGSGGGGSGGSSSNSSNSDNSNSNNSHSNNNNIGCFDQRQLSDVFEGFMMPPTIATVTNSGSGDDNALGSPNKMVFA